MTICDDVMCHKLPVRKSIYSYIFLLQILDGFVIILSATGQVLYVSDSIKESLEHSPHNIVGEYIQRFAFLLKISGNYGD